jgi:hypothetical protein
MQLFTSNFHHMRRSSNLPEGGAIYFLRALQIQAGRPLVNDYSKKEKNWGK